MSEPNENHCQRICLTPTRNESWIIKPFLAAAKCWADHIIVADQGSTDGTLQELQRTAGVQTLVNESPAYDEAQRQRLLINAARKISGKRIFIALDADEALSANCLPSAEWQRLAEAKPGTVLRFRWVNILPRFKQAWIPSEPTALGFIDDGSEHTGEKIHSRRVPWPANSPVIDLAEVVVLHFQYVAWERMLSKHRWYQAWEALNHPQKAPLEIFRKYHHMYGSWDASEIHPVKPEWLDGYERAGVSFRSLQGEPVTWWDKELLQMLREHGTARFRKLDIWDKDWNEVAHTLGLNGADFRDPRSATEKTVHRLLAATQKRRANLGVRALERSLRSLGW